MEEDVARARLAREAMPENGAMGGEFSTEGDISIIKGKDCGIPRA